MMNVDKDLPLKEDYAKCKEGANFVVTPWGTFDMVSGERIVFPLWTSGWTWHVGSGTKQEKEVV